MKKATIQHYTSIAVPRELLLKVLKDERVLVKDSNKDWTLGAIPTWIYFPVENEETANQLTKE